MKASSHWEFTKDKEISGPEATKTWRNWTTVYPELFQKETCIKSIPSAPRVDSESEEVEVEVLEEDVNDEIAVEIVTDSGGEHL